MSTRSGKPFHPDEKPSDMQAKKDPPASLLPPWSDTKSVNTKISGSSHGSSASSGALKARAKVEAARAKLVYAEKEAALLKQKAEFEASMLVLQSEKDVAAAAAEATVYEEAEGSESRDDRHSLPEEKSQDRTEAFVRTHFEELAPETPVQRPNDMGGNGTDIAKYLVRRDLVSTMLTKYDDEPHHYRSWKASFLDVTRELGLTPREELNLLVKWLGDRSSVHAKRMRGVYPADSKKALDATWKRLEEIYGSPEVIEQALLDRLERFPKLAKNDNTKLRELGDLLLEVECAKDEGFLSGLAYFDTPRGIKPIAEKLPHNLQERWMGKGAQYKEKHGVAFPPFSVFSQFVRREASIRNDPSFTSRDTAVESTKTVRVNLTDTSESVQTATSKCPIHQSPHPLDKCRAFLSKTQAERRAFLKENRICYRCLDATDHVARDCKATIRCEECQSEGHNTALHFAKPSPQGSTEDDGGEETTQVVTPKCTEVCGRIPGGRSCSKICQVRVYTEGNEHQAVHAYAVLDEQSNRSLGKSELFDTFGVKSQATPYTMRTCSGTTETSGRQTSDLMLSSLDGKITLQLPSLIECDEIPDDRSEIPSREIARQYPHLERIAHEMTNVDPEIPILLLLGRDVLRVHKVREQINGPHDAPYAQRLDLGWVIVGEACLGKSHKPGRANVYKANILSNGRASMMEPCPNVIQVKEEHGVGRMQRPPLLGQVKEEHGVGGMPEPPPPPVSHGDVPAGVGDSLFLRTKDDERPSLSVEDREFLGIMDREVYQDESKSWVSPLPFKPERRRLPNNREHATRRLYSLRKSLERNPTKKEQFVEFVQKMLDNGHAEPAPPLDNETERWYLPMFGVHHPQKPDQIRVVFDSSAEFRGVSLNEVLLSGPDLNNGLIGVLIRFRRERIAFSADVQQMFYCFYVREDHRDFLRFLWYEENDMDRAIAEYRMKVHVFGNSPSPSVAIYCMRRAASEGEGRYGSDATRLVKRDFYVDDALSSAATDQAAIDLLTRAKGMLAESNLNLHKIASNSQTVMSGFDAGDRAKDIKDLDLSSDPLPLQRSLGLWWDLEHDCFTFKVPCEKKAFTRRGVLSTINSLYDPLGFAAPVTLKGKAMLRELSLEAKDWDSPLTGEREAEWNEWRNSLRLLEDIHIPRCYARSSVSSFRERELCLFADASTLAVGAVAYLKVTDDDGNSQVGFVMGKSRLAPKPAHTIPRLELCAAVLAVELSETVQGELDIPVDSVTFHTDSRIVLGYIRNNTRRFYVYVANRVNRIRKASHPSQWRYVATEHNPADIASRSIATADLRGSIWFSGPEFLTRPEEVIDEEDDFDLVNPEVDAEIRPQVTTLITNASKNGLGSHRFRRFSSWRNLCRAIGGLIQVVKRFQKTPCVPDQPQEDIHMGPGSIVVTRCVQEEVFAKELRCLRECRPLPKSSPLTRLNPVIDENGLLRVGGRLSSAALSRKERHPIIIPHNSYLATLIARHYHERVVHQGRHFTEGAVRAAGYWVTGSKRLVSSIIHKCVICRRLRGRAETQIMAALPADRVTPGPPFTSVGVDVFGPWEVVTRRTRGGSADSKRWAVIFSCMSTRAVHIEVIEALSTSSFINALRRFFAVRGPAKVLRSDRGTNFVGACKELGIIADANDVEDHLRGKGCVWMFNPPHASHMGGSWERMIGIARKILDAMFLTSAFTRLTHEVLSTLMAEVMAIMNARPLAPISSDSDRPAILTPAMLLTQKVDATSAPDGDFDQAPLHTKQWRQVQSLADTFWKRWKQDYLGTLQGRRKWTEAERNLRVGDVVLLKDADVCRNEWPVGLIVNTYPADDGKVRRVDVRVLKDGKPKVFLRPITEVFLLLEQA